MTNFIPNYELLTTGKSMEDKRTTFLERVLSTDFLAKIYLPADPAHTNSRLFSWKPTVSIEVGVQNTVDWYLKNREFLNRIKD